MIYIASLVSELRWALSVRSMLSGYYYRGFAILHKVLNSCKRLFSGSRVELRHPGSW